MSKPASILTPRLSTHTGGFVVSREGCGSGENGCNRRTRPDPKGRLMTPHVHISPVHGVAVIALVIAVFGTAHLLSLTHENRATRAFLGMGF